MFKVHQLHFDVGLLRLLVDFSDPLHQRTLFWNILDDFVLRVLQKPTT